MTLHAYSLMSREIGMTFSADGTDRNAECFQESLKDLYNHSGFPADFKQPPNAQYVAET